MENSSHSVDDRYNLNSGTTDGKNKQKKKTSKFHRVRLGDGSMASLSDSKSSDTDPEPSQIREKQLSMVIRTLKDCLYVVYGGTVEVISFWPRL